MGWNEPPSPAPPRAGDGDGARRVNTVLDGRYRLEVLVGEGGMGSVYRARHMALDRRVAVKVLRGHLVGDPVSARRFAREARGTFKVDSPHAVKVLDYAVADDGTLYMVLEYLDGRTVAAELEVDGALAPARAVHVARQTCHALAAAHRLGLVHRDIKPENLMLIRHEGDADFVKVLDFGLARLMEGAAPGVLSVAALTQGDLVFGTPDYMSPEQALGQPLDGRSDLYALGATLFEMLTGRRLFDEATAMGQLASHVQVAAPHLAEVRPSLAELSPYADLDALVQRCVAKLPAARPDSAQALGAELATLEAALARRGGRIAPSVAASRTMDFDTVAAPESAPALAAAPARVADLDAPPPRRSRRRWLGLAIAAAAVAGLAIGARSRRGRSITPSRTTSITAPAPAPAPTRRPTRRPTPELSPGPGPSRLPSPDPSPSPLPSRSPPPSPPSPRRHISSDPSFTAHLAAAEQARASSNRLRQLAEADAALRLDPGHLRARFLLGDALLATGDIVSGCRYLRTARRLPAARAALAACPPD